VTATNPAVPSGLVIYNFHDRAYKAVPETADQHVSVHLAVTGASPGASLLLAWLLLHAWRVCRCRW